MTKEFEKKVMTNGSVDTKKYRYNLFYCGDHGEIRRIEIKKLGTTDAINGWEVVKKYY